MDSYPMPRVVMRSGNSVLHKVTAEAPWAIAALAIIALAIGLAAAAGRVGGKQLASATEAQKRYRNNDAMALAIGASVAAAVIALESTRHATYDARPLVHWLRAGGVISMLLAAGFAAGAAVNFRSPDSCPGCKTVETEADVDSRNKGGSTLAYVATGFAAIGTIILIAAASAWAWMRRGKKA